MAASTGWHHRSVWATLTIGLLVLLSGCQQWAFVQQDPPKPYAHIQQPTQPKKPESALPLPAPKLQLSTVLAPQTPLDRQYTVSFRKTSVEQVLYALARKTGLQLNMKPLPGQQRITLYLKNAPLRTILEQISKQANIRYRLQQNTLIIEPDTPYWKTYTIDYVNISSDFKSETQVSLQLSTTQTGTTATTAQQGTTRNQNTLSANSTGENQFWTRLKSSIEAILSTPNAETAPQANTDPQTNAADTPQAAPNNRVFINQEAGLLLAYATAHQHHKIQSLIEKITTRAKKQVLIEATVVEVDLTESSKMGIDWSNFKLSVGGANVGSTQAAIVYDSTKPYLIDNFTFNMGINFLKQFGNVKVLSTPKIMALNNQTAILKVVNNHVYFTTAIDTQVTQGTSTTNVTTELKSTPVGFVMGVTPFVGANGDITLQIKPSISRVVGYAKDPNPLLAQAGTESLIPIIQQKEMSTIMQLQDQQIAILGGLMRDETNNAETGFPLGETGDVLNNLVGYHAGEKIKTELIIFLRPTVIKQPTNSPFDNATQKYKSLLPQPDTKGQRQ